MTQPPSPASAVSSSRASSVPTEPVRLTSRLERFDSFWEGPTNVDRGYSTVCQFYRANYLRHLPQSRDARILVVSCGPGYFVKVLNDIGYLHVTGIDSDPSKVAHAKRRGLNCKVATAFEELRETTEPYDVVICEQELNHLTKAEMVDFLRLVHDRLAVDGCVLCHGLNGANPIVGAETLAQNFDHFNTFTAYSLEQVLEYAGFSDIHVFGLNLYVFYRNPLNYVGWLVTGMLHLLFRALFVLYGKSNRIFTKKIAAVACKRS